MINIKKQAIKLGFLISAGFFSSTIHAASAILSADGSAAIIEAYQPTDPTGLLRVIQTTDLSITAAANAQDIRVLPHSEVYLVFNDPVTTLTYTGEFVLRTGATVKLLGTHPSQTAAEGFQLEGATFTLPTSGYANFEILAGLIEVPADLDHEHFRIRSMNNAALLNGPATLTATIDLYRNLNIVASSAVRTLAGHIEGRAKLIVPTSTLQTINSTYSKDFSGEIDITTGAAFALKEPMGKLGGLILRSDVTFTVTNPGTIGRLKPLGTTAACILSPAGSLTIDKVFLDSPMTISTTATKSVTLTFSEDSSSVLTLSGSGSVILKNLPESVTIIPSADTSVTYPK